MVLLQTSASFPISWNFRLNRGFIIESNFRVLRLTQKFDRQDRQNR